MASLTGKNRVVKIWTVALIVWCLARGICAADVEKDKGIPEVPIKDTVTLLDLGSHKCIPCKMMAPILAKLKKDYDGRAAVIFIDVFEHREQAQRFGVRAIPTQIFFDNKGKEVFRHEGFMSEEEIVQQLKKMGMGLKDAPKAPRPVSSS